MMDSFMLGTTIVALLLLHVINVPEVAGKSLAFLATEPPARHRSNSRDTSTSLRLTLTLTRTEAADVMNTLLMPTSEYDDRERVGGLAQFGTDVDVEQVISANDPRTSLTYAEFPLHSFDQLVDCALSHASSSSSLLSSSSSSSPPCLLDLGSGCARLVLYAALSRPGCIVHGIEISELLHGKAMEALQRGMDHGYFLTDDSDSTTTSTTSNIQLHCGPASDDSALLAHVWEEAHVVFCYSTVWPAPDFSISLQAMVLGPEWSHLLATVCRPGCIVITTDRVLNPLDGWVLLDRMDVDNPQLWGSTGYIQRLVK